MVPILEIFNSPSLRSGMEKTFSVLSERPKTPFHEPAPPHHVVNGDIDHRNVGPGQSLLL